MSVPQTVAEVLRNHVTLEVEGIDRMYLNVSVPQLQRELGIVGFLRYHLGDRFASSAMLAPISDAFRKSIAMFAKAQDIPLFPFAKGQRKDDIAYEALDNGVLSCEAPARLQELCDGLSAGKIDALLRKWLAKLPHPFTAVNRRAGYGYALSILQSEFSLTQVLDRPLLGEDPNDMTPGRMTDPLRRLRLHGLIVRQPGTHRYDVTAFGLRIALFFTRSYAHLLRPGLAQLTTDALAPCNKLSHALRRFEAEIDQYIRKEKLAA